VSYITRRKEQTIQSPEEKNRRYNLQKKRTDDTISRRKEQTIQSPEEKVKLHFNEMMKMSALNWTSVGFL
jgi:hypothetical protein